MDELVWNHMDIVESVAKRLNLDSALVADVGLEALISASKNYTNTRGKFRAYAHVCVRNAMICYMRSHKISLPILEDVEQPTFAQMEEYDVNLLKSVLDEDEYKLLYQYYGEDRSTQQLGDEYGVSRSTIWVRIQRILKKLQ